MAQKREESAVLDVRAKRFLADDVDRDWQEHQTDEQEAQKQAMSFAPLRFACWRCAPVSFALFKSGRTSGFSALHAFQTVTPSLSFARCSGFAIDLVGLELLEYTH